MSKTNRVRCGCPECNPVLPPPSVSTEEVLRRRREAEEQRDIRRAREEFLAEQKRREPLPPPAPPSDQQCIFAKSLNVPRGHSCYPGTRAPSDGLGSYGDYAVLGTTEAISEGGAALHFIDGSLDALTLSGRLGRGALSLARTVPALEGAQAGAAAGGTVAGGLLAGTVAMLIPNWSLAPDAAFYKREDFANLTVANTGVRINIKYLPEESVSAFGVYTGHNPVWRSVPLIAATEQGERLVADLGDGLGLIWTPAAGTRDKPAIPALEGAPQLPSAHVYPEVEQAERIYEHPVLEEDFRDAIIWFPTRPELSPIYLSISLRDAPGVVTGEGEDVSGIWLAGAVQGLGVPIPRRIAESLRGREFSSFAAFRRAFWRLTAADPALSNQFTKRDVARLRKGKAKRVREHEAVGGRQSYELHHLEHISEGGKVYDVDNLRVNTPKNHIEIHRRK